MSLEELASISTSLDDIVRRLDRMRSEAAETGEEETAAELEEIGRSLRAAARRLSRLSRSG